MSINDTISILRSLEQLSQTYDYNENNSYNKEFLDIYLKKSYNFNLEEHKIKSAFLYANYYLFRDKNNEAIAFYNKSLKHEFSIEDSTLIPAIYNNIGSLYSENLNKPDSAIHYFKKQHDFLKRYQKFSNPISLFYNALNTGSAYNKLGDLNKAILFYEKADSIELNEKYLSNKSYIKENLANTNFEAKNYKRAYEYLNQYLNLSDSLNIEDQRIAIANIKEEYDNEKLRADNLESENKRKQNRNLLIGAIVFILFGGTTMLLIQKNTRKKQKLAEQEKALETQKLATVLKEQELISIDAMIEGQEKERQRIANDLHDDLGGLMASVKLHFNVLKEKQTPELFNKTTTLIDEAYKKIRSVAHSKNSGVIAKQGLLVAVKNMANKISVANKLTLQVIDHGLENRLENSLELTIFRIIQELITNVIKHAEATEVTIHLTNHEDTLNIMVEDDGKGFNPNQITTKNKGMGISSIDKRVEHLGGTMTIESEPKKGTTVIIDIPT
ncbi:tetratricopeptide repeat-containing sensor histidine kinase [Jejuia pallidilutea]|nr:sensor histidine kinase [Jejuia pallidilutea]